MSGSLVDRCRDYSRKMHKLIPLDSYYFPGFHGGLLQPEHDLPEVPAVSVEGRHLHSGSGPKVHDLRHAYCVHRLKKWVLDGQELTNLLPYLAVYLGYVDFRGTEYYLRLTADLYPEIVSRMEFAFGYIIPGRGEE